MPCKWISSLSCWKPNSTLPSATSDPTGDARRRLHDAVLDLCRNAPALEQFHQRHATGAGGVAQAACRQNRLLHRRFRAQIGSRRAGAHGDGDAGADEIQSGSGDDFAGLDQLLNGVGGQDHEIEGFSRLHALGGIDATDGLDGDRLRALLLELADQVRQQLLGGHGRNDADGGCHAATPLKVHGAAVKGRTGAAIISVLCDPGGVIGRAGIAAGHDRSTGRHGAKHGHGQRRRGLARHAWFRGAGLCPHPCAGVMRLAATRQPGWTGRPLPAHLQAVGGEAGIPLTSHRGTGPRRSHCVSLAASFLYSGGRAGRGLRAAAESEGTSAPQAEARVAARHAWLPHTINFKAPTALLPGRPVSPATLTRYGCREGEDFSITKFPHVSLQRLPSTTCRARAEARRWLCRQARQARPWYGTTPRRSVHRPGATRIRCGCENLLRAFRFDVPAAAALRQAAGNIGLK
jgi:hypothetical protein